MPSEIPQLEVITAISEVETEDFIAQLLFSQGWSIIHRAIDFSGLLVALENRHNLLRTVIIYSSDLPNLDPLKLAEIESHSSAFSLICIDGVSINSHAVMTHIRGQLRLPLIYQNHTLAKSDNFPTATPKKQKLITVTGTAGSPGRSHLTLLLAGYFSWRTQVHVFDADLRSPSLAYMAGNRPPSNERFSLTTLQMEDKPSELPTSELKELTFVDIGALPSLREVVTDRRWHAAFINNILEQTSSLIYITKSSGLGLLRLENFIAEFPILLRKIPILYVLNQRTNSREDRAIEARFISLTSGEAAFVLPQDPRPLQPSAPRTKGLDLFSASSKLAKEIDKIAQSIA